MIKINLLSIQRARKKKKASTVQSQWILAGVLFFGLLGSLGYAWVYLTQTVDRLRVEKVKLTDELAMLKGQVKEVENFEHDKKAVEEKIGVIQQLQRNQTIPIRLLAEISERLPDRVWLISLAEQNNQISLEGKATGNGEIVDFINALKKSTFFENIEIEESRQVVEASIPVYTFKLKWRIRVV